MAMSGCKQKVNLVFLLNGRTYERSARKQHCILQHVRIIRHTRELHIVKESTTYTLLHILLAFSKKDFYFYQKFTSLLPQ
jgi:hypothetical protein